MRTTTVSVLLGGLAVLALTGCSGAQDAVVQPSDPTAAGKTVQATSAQPDRKLTTDELKAHLEARKVAMFRRADKDGNGSLEPDEVGERRWARIQVADANGDGRVTAVELDQARAAGKLPMGVHGDHDEHHGLSPDAMMKKFDKNGDGSLEASEVSAKMWAHVGRADADGDGKISTQELEQARAHRRQAR